MSTRSAFGTLLKHSKFSSFDPRISQVYTTHGGDAHRGHWGFKRPLPLRRRGAYITVRSIDTTEHQTEWNSAEPQALWIKNWDELKITPHQPSFDSAEEHIDSDYVPRSQFPQQWRQPYIPNLKTMSHLEFAHYLESVRARRNGFLKQHMPPGQHDIVTSYQLSGSNKPSTQWHELFAAQLSRQRRSTHRSREIEDLPHSSRGLSYAHYSPLQTFFMTKERKGRLAEEWRARDRNLMGYTASFARMAGSVPKKHVGTGRPLVWDDPNQTGEVMIRPQKAILKKWPVVVGERQGLKAAGVDMELKVWDEQSHHRSNPHPPGSREYIVAEPPRSVDELTTQATVGKIELRRQRRVHPSQTLALLRSAIAKSEPTPGSS